MRSRCVAWWLRRSGLEPVLLRGGYKALKEHCAHLYWPRCTTDQLALLVCGQAVADLTGRFGQTRPRIVIVGGRTGSGKTRVLAALRSVGAQVLDLEGLAHHRGSAFGWIGQLPQPSTEQYGLDVALAWRALDPAQVVFVEDEGSSVGKVSVPPLLFAAMRRAPLIVKLVVPLEARLHMLVEDYAGEEAKATTVDWGPRMEEAIARMGKRLGGDTVKGLLASLAAGDVRGVALQMLQYYDKLYDKHVGNASGSGSGTGARPGCLVEAAADPAATRLDDGGLAAVVLEKVAAKNLG
jgi:tRNA 2-selenouridine synthase